MRKTILMLCTCFALASLAQVPCRWEVESSRSAPGQFNCYRGETLLIQPTIKEYGSAMTNYSASLYYQTNGMGSAWWQGTNGMYFTPAMDVGASVYSVYIQAVKTNGISYRANAIIRMLGSPGATPNIIPLPVQRIDFASVQYLNAPWLLSADLDPVESRIEGVEAFTNAWNAAASWGNHATAGYLASSVWLTWLNTNTFLRVESDAIALSSIAAHETNQTAHASLMSKFLTNETDAVSLRAYHYGSSDIIESPASWFTFNAEWQTITEYINPANGADVVIPWAINGVEVKWIGSSAFKDAVINSVIAPKTLTSLDPSSFKNCSFKTAVFPALTYIDEGSFNNCPFLNSITWGSDAPDVEELEYLFEDSNIVTNYVNSLTAVGWGALFGDRPVIRIGVSAGSLTLGGVTKSAWPAASSGVPSIWTNQLWGAVGTNAVYRISWDVTNGTFKVEELLP